MTTISLERVYSGELELLSSYGEDLPKYIVNKLHVCLFKYLYSELLNKEAFR